MVKCSSLSLRLQNRSFHVVERTRTAAKRTIKAPLSLLADIGSLLYALVNVFHPDWLIRSNFRLRRSDNLHKDSHQNSWIYPRVKMKNAPAKREKVQFVILNLQICDIVVAAVVMID